MKGRRGLDAFMSFTFQSSGRQTPQLRDGQERRRMRRGVVLVYACFLMIIILGLVSLAVDYARVQVVKTQLQRLADATARGSLQIYADSGASAATTYGPMLSTSSFNPVDVNSGMAPTLTLTSGFWTPATKTFSTSSGTLVAVKVVATRTAANGNAVPLTFPLLTALGGAIKTTCNVTATAIAVLQPAVTNTVTVPGKADLWLSGMPAGSTASYDDTEAADPAVLGMNVTAGTILSFSSTGSTAQNSSYPYYSAEGSLSNVTSHMEYAPNGDYNGLQNGIQTITAPEVSLLGVFLTASQPSTQTPPSSGLDYSTSASQNYTSYSSLQLQQPFYIGNGQTSGGVTQSFVVPTGATRLYLATFECYQNNDNLGSLSVTVTQQAVVYLVQ